MRPSKEAPLKPAWILIPLAALAVLMLVPLTNVLGDDEEPAVFAIALGNGITYQGRFTDGGEPADGSYDIRFILYDAEAGGAQVGTQIDRDNIAVNDGLFTTTLDFGAAAWDGDARWLEIAVRPGTSTGNFTVLNPRQPVTAVPYALHALTAGGFSVPFSATGDVADELLSLTQDGDGEAIVANRAATETSGNTIVANNVGAGAAVRGVSTHATGTGGSFSGPTAIELTGGVKVVGANPAAFTVVVDFDGNTCDFGGTDNAVVVDNANANGIASAFLFITYDSTGDVTPHTGAFAVAYDVGSGGCTDDRWIIFQTDGTPLEDNDAFNVLVINQG
jgi:hypothetical protein